MTNQAYLRIYEDMACTKEIKNGLSDSYIVSIMIPTGHGNINFRRNLYIKNTGTHTAYNVTSNKIYDSSNKATVSVVKNTLRPKESTIVEVGIQYLKGETTSHLVTVELEYDNIP